jgi:hypothetical protein
MEENKNNARLNIIMSEELRRKFKLYAVTRNMSMTDITIGLIEDLLKNDTTGNT